jgi:hypothetical protein
MPPSGEARPLTASPRAQAQQHSDPSSTPQPRLGNQPAVRHAWAEPYPRQLYPPKPELQACATRPGETSREWGAFIALGFRPEWRGGTNYTRLCVQRREITRRSRAPDRTAWPLRRPPTAAGASKKIATQPSLPRLVGYAGGGSTGRGRGGSNWRRRF